LLFSAAAGLFRPFSDCLSNESIVALASLPNKVQQANFGEPLGSLKGEPLSNIEAEICAG
jgi:hypothetical protein